MKTLVATNNAGKVKRYRELLDGEDVQFVTPSEEGIPDIHIVENAETLAGNAEKKVRPYFSKTKLPILANDTGLWVEGEGFMIAPKREALQGAQEHELTKEEVAMKMQEFWQGVARKHGGKVNAEWREAFVCLHPSGELRVAESVRHMILTDTLFGKPNVSMPIRALMISQATGVPSVLQTKEQERDEMKEVIAALEKVLL